MIIRILGKDLGEAFNVEGVVSDLRQRLAEEFENSRFDLNWRLIDTERWRRAGDAGLRLRKGCIRLKESKEFCGNHPCGCEVGNPKHRHARFLEGADWVEFNDRLNTVLDTMGLSADVESVACELRRGFCRRTVYREGERQGNGNYAWDKSGDPGDYENYVGRVAPRSEFPVDTPGIYGAEYHVVG